MAGRVQPQGPEQIISNPHSQQCEHSVLGIILSFNPGSGLEQQTYSPVLLLGKQADRGYLPKVMQPLRGRGRTGAGTLPPHLDLEPLGLLSPSSLALPALSLHPETHLRPCK